MPLDYWQNASGEKVRNKKGIARPHKDEFVKKSWGYLKHTKPRKRHSTIQGTHTTKQRKIQIHLDSPRVSRLTFSVPLTALFIRRWTGRSSFPTMFLLWIFLTVFWRPVPARRSAIIVTVRFTDALPFLFTTALLPWRSTSWSALFPVVPTMFSPLLGWRAFASFSPTMLFPTTSVMSRKRAGALATRWWRTPMMPAFFTTLFSWITPF